MFKSLRLLILFFILSTNFLFPQPHLVITPGEIEFQNVFNRLGNLYFINTGTETLVVDSIVYNRDYYFVRFDAPLSYPLTLNPGDTTQMDCIMAGYYYVPSADTLNTMYIYSNSVDGMEEVKIRIRYYSDESRTGIINGQVTDGSVPVQGANVNFFYAGNYLMRTVQTDENGFYSVSLPPGSYKIAIEKASYYTTFFGQQFDPLNAEFVTLLKDSIKTANIILSPMKNTSIKVSGRVFDMKAGSSLRKSIVVTRPGSHSPTKRGERTVTTDDPSVYDAYTAFVNSDGTFSIDNIIDPGYYYVQSFSDYFVPSYYSSSANPTFWQQADSVFIDSDVSNLNIYMPRDSSIGGGSVSGKINITPSSGDTISDVIIYAEAINSESSIFNYAFSDHDGTFKIPFLPYGSYRLVAQKIGYNDGYSSEFTIGIQNTDVKDLNIALSPTSVDENPFVPENHVLLYNYPNPFNPSTTIGFNLPFSSDVQVKLVNILGEDIKTLVKDFFAAGCYEVALNAADLASGTYFVILRTEKNLIARKIILLK